MPIKTIKRELKRLKYLSTWIQQVKIGAVKAQVTTAEKLKIWQ